MFGDLGKMFKLISEMKTKLPQLQERLAATEYTSQAGDGAVTATVNGRLQLVDIKIDAAKLDHGDTGQLEDCIKSAVAAAQTKAAEDAARQMRELTGGMDLPGLSELLG
jgi:DNA-binding YbaB/EbfC family protein